MDACDGPGGHQESLSVCLSVHCQPVERRMLCLRRPPEQARPSGSACLSARVREAAGQVSCRAAFGVGSFTPKLCVAVVTPVRPREAIASAITFCSKTREQAEKKP